MLSSICWNSTPLLVILIDVVRMVLENAQKSGHMQSYKVANKTRSTQMVTSSFPHCTKYMYLYKVLLCVGVYVSSVANVR